jgi:hypothetical protein
VSRVWERESGDYEMVLVEAVDRGLDAVHVEFHPGLFGRYDERSAGPAGGEPAGPRSVESQSGQERPPRPYYPEPGRS